jgi:2-oxoacid:acceptor oxidoreductase delta subunit (pyruvate/2-ketoisovalerate family)
MEENLTGNWRSLRPVIDAARCTGCLICWKFCPEACVNLTDKVPAIGLSYCKGCGVCVAECPPKAIRFEDEAGI